LPVISDRIHQVFLNLILNALEAMPDGGELKITIKETDHPKGVIISFKDSGNGIPEDELKKLFAAFHSTKRGGLGLGLFVSKSIVKEHGGEMSVSSEYGKGTTFTVWLPGEDINKNMIVND
jgi:signal transduction histidine kinase